jgi:hypothetical protein
MSAVSSEPGAGGAGASVRGGCNETGGDETPCDESCSDETHPGIEGGGGAQEGWSAAARGGGDAGGGADPPLALPRVGRWHVLKLPAEAGDKDLLGRRPDELRNCLFGFVSSGSLSRSPSILSSGRQHTEGG